MVVAVVVVEEKEREECHEVYHDLVMCHRLDHEIQSQHLTRGGQKGGRTS